MKKRAVIKARDEAENLRCKKQPLIPHAHPSTLATPKLPKNDPRIKGGVVWIRQPLTFTSKFPNDTVRRGQVGPGLRLVPEGSSIRSMT
jgi:hypothetical protein